ncbi:MAG: phage tail tape measure protein [Roseburia sp.]|nr:phage tail tape measure protein [Roseburia sp.]MCM1097739.1 phage tail tape measure protein [Ruminococcus flavefaciens]
MASSSKEMELAIKIAGKVEASFTNALGKAGSGIQALTKTITAATAAAAAAVGAIGAAAVNVGKEFETAMSQVQATMLLDTSTAEGAADMATLEEAARECGRTTAFSATEAAEALNYLALAGYNADEAATALPTVLKLAGAGAMDLAAASDMVTDSMSALGIEATEANLNTFADQLAQTASKANTSVAQLGEAILTVGGTAKGLAGGTTELNTALGILADNGLKGAEGGTHLRNMILSLQSPTGDASKALQSLGVDVYDAQGNMRGLNDIFKDLQSGMEGMTAAQKDSIISTLFNKTDLTAANAMLSNCTDRWDELSAAIENSAGACEDMYSIQLDNLDGDIKILQSGLSDLGISIYKDLNGPLREMTQLGTSMVEELSQAYSEGGMAGMVGAVGDCLSEAVNVIAGYAPQVVSMGVDLISSFVQGIADNAGQLADTAAQVLTTFINGLFTLIPQVLLAGIDIITQLANSIASQLPTLITNGTQAIENLVSGITQRLPDIITAGLTLVQTLVSSLGANAPQLIAAAINLIGNLVLGIVSMLPQLLQMGIQLILSLAQGIISNLPLLLQMAVQIITQLVTGIVSMLPMLIQGGIQLIISLIQGIISNLGNIVQAAVQIVVTLATGLIQAIPQLIAAIPQLIGALIEAIFTTNWLQVGIDIIKGLIDGIISTGKSLWNAIKSLFTGGEVDIPDTSSQSAAVVDSYASGIQNNAGAVTTAASSMATNAFSNMDTSGATSAGTTVATAYTTGMTDALSGFTFDTSVMGMDTAALTTNMTAAGTAGGEALTSSLNQSVAGMTLDTSGIAVDTAGLTGTLTTAGAEGATAISTGMTNNAGAVTTAASSLATDVNGALDAGWSTAQNKADSALSSLVNTVQTKAQAAAQAVKSAFENMTITIPKPRIPVISVSTNSVSYGDGGSVSVPQFSVNWNALGGIFGSPTVLNTASNGLQGVGEAGAEAVLPLDTLWSKMKSMLDSAIKESSGGGVIESLLQRLQSIGTGGGGGTGGPELAGAGGPNISYSPTYNLYGSATKEDAVEAERMSQAEFNQMMKQWQRENDRKKF